MNVCKIFVLIDDFPISGTRSCVMAREAVVATNPVARNSPERSVFNGSDGILDPSTGWLLGAGGMGSLTGAPRSLAPLPGFEPSSSGSESDSSGARWYRS